MKLDALESATSQEQARADRIAEMRERGKTYGQIGLALGMSESNISWIDAIGATRPCSRCDVEGFERWLKERSPVALTVAEQLTAYQRPEG